MSTKNNKKMTAPIMVSEQAKLDAITRTKNEIASRAKVYAFQKQLENLFPVLGDLEQWEKHTALETAYNELFSIAENQQEKTHVITDKSKAQAEKDKKQLETYLANNPFTGDKNYISDIPKLSECKDSAEYISKIYPYVSKIVIISMIKHGKNTRISNALLNMFHSYWNDELYKDCEQSIGLAMWEMYLNGECTVTVKNPKTKKDFCRIFEVNFWERSFSELYRVISRECGKYKTVHGKFTNVSLSAFVNADNELSADNDTDITDTFNSLECFQDRMIILKATLSSESYHYLTTLVHYIVKGGYLADLQKNKVLYNKLNRIFTLSRDKIAIASYYQRFNTFPADVNTKTAKRYKALFDKIPHFKTLHIA